MNERTPKTATVRTAWVKGHPFPLTTDLEERDAEFWRWLAAHDRETAARAWDDGYQQGRSDQADHSMYHQTHTDNPYRRD